VRTLKGHSHWVRSVAFSADSKLVASGSNDNTVKIWDAATGAEVRTLKGHSSSVNSVAFPADSKLVASGSDDKTVKIWDAATGAEVRTLKGHSHWVRSVAFSADSKLVASGSDDNTVKIWDAATGKEVQTLNVGTSLKTISFDAMSSCLITDIGLIRLNSANPPDISTETQGLAPLQLARLEYGLSSDRTWISWNGHDVLWLPPDYRPSASAILLSSFAIGCRSGRVFIIGFSGTPISL
jgi:WD40 repeat protein